VTIRQLCTPHRGDNCAVTNPARLPPIAAVRPPAPRVDLFCTVVDNYGDAGVAWRLARRLASGHGAAVTLWIDDLAPLARMAPGVTLATAPGPTVAGITVRPKAAADAAAAGVGLDAAGGGFGAAVASADAASLSAPGTAPAPGPDVVIDAFGGGAPDAYVEAIAHRPAPPLWFVLEYLSAEPWVDDAHGLPSPHPRLPLLRRFWFPGFTGRTGGLLREPGLLAARDAFRADAAARGALWRRVGVPAPVGDEVRVTLFCYPNPRLPALLAAWAGGSRPVRCLVPAGVAREPLDAWTGGRALRVGDGGHVRGALTVHAIPFVPQDDYDRLLWAADVNFVRGEDSFVRAQWAGHPFVWQAYPQEGGAHFVKVDAFLDRYAPRFGPGAGAAIRGLFRAWNGAPTGEGVAEAWARFARARARVDAADEAWAAELAALPELADGLAKAAGFGL
jgi:uncharacterized repeat protein (TIGR03837 family)